MAMGFIAGYVLGARNKARASGLAASADTFAAIGQAASMDRMNERVDRLVLVVQAMWSLLEENGYTAEDLQLRISALDAADGVADGTITRQPRRCPSCGAMVGAGLDHCQFCGHAFADAGGSPIDL